MGNFDDLIPDEDAMLARSHERQDSAIEEEEMLRASREKQEAAFEVKITAEPITRKGRTIADKQWAREYMNNGEPVVDSFPPNERPAFQSPDLSADTPTKLRQIRRQEGAAAQVAETAWRLNDRKLWNRMAKLEDRLFQERQALFEELRRTNPDEYEVLFDEYQLK